MSLLLRKAQLQDRTGVLEVEMKSTPGLRHLPHVFDQFVADEQGEFIVAELDGQLVGCGKFTLLPDGSAWLETLRVSAERQGLGIGKEFYRRFFEIAHAKKISTMRLYTGINNHVSKGLAEKFGFSVVETYRGQKRSCQPDRLQPSPGAFRPVTDPAIAAELLLPYREAWGSFLVINRTFYAFTPALAIALARQGMLYSASRIGSVVVLGARFMPQQALHIGLLGGDLTTGLSFALYTGMQAGAHHLSCYCPSSAASIQAELHRHNFQFEASDIIVMEAHISTAQD